MVRAAGFNGLQELQRYSVPKKGNSTSSNATKNTATKSLNNGDVEVIRVGAKRTTHIPMTRHYTNDGIFAHRFSVGAHDYRNTRSEDAKFMENIAIANMAMQGTFGLLKQAGQIYSKYTSETPNTMQNQRRDDIASTSSNGNSTSTSNIPSVATSHLSSMKGANTPAELRTAIANAQSELNDIPAKLSELENSKTMSKEDFDKKKTDLKNKKQDVKDKQKEVSDLEKSITKQKETIESCKTSVQAKSAEYKEACQDTKDKQSALTTATNNFNQAVADLNKAQAALNAASNDDPNYSKLQEAVNKAQQARDTAENAKKDAETALDNAEKNEQKVLQELDEAKNDLGSAKKLLLAEQKKLNESEQRLETLKEEQAKLEKEEAELQDKVEKEQKISDEINQLESDQNSLKSEIDTQQKRLEKMEKNYEKEIEKMNKKSNDRRDKISDRETRINNEDGLSLAEKIRETKNMNLSGKVAAADQKIEKMIDDLGLDKMATGQQITLDGVTYQRASDGNFVKAEYYNDYTTALDQPERDRTQRFGDNDYTYQDVLDTTSKFDINAMRQIVKDDLE